MTSSLTTTEAPKAKLAAALAKAQAAFGPAPKSATNSHQKYNYATVSDYIEASRKGLADNGLSLTFDVHEVTELPDLKVREGPPGALRSSIRLRRGSLAQPRGACGSIRQGRPDYLAGFGS